MSGTFNNIFMSTSKIRIRKNCLWCGKEFEAQKTSTKYCCKRCSEHAYKENKRQERKNQAENYNQLRILGESQKSVEKIKFLSVIEAAKFLNITRDGIYKLIYRGSLPAYRLSSQWTVIKREDIEKMIDARPYERKPRATSNIQDEKGEQITEFYTTKEIMAKFGVSNSWVFAQAKINKIPKVFHLGKTLWSKVHCDRVFTKKPEPPKENDWISYADTMAEFNLTRDQLYSYVKYHGLRRKKVGKQTFIVRAEIESLLKPPTL